MRSVKETFVIAERLKDGPFDTHEAFLASLERSKREVTSWPDCELDAFIGSQDRVRLDFYNRARWRLDSVNLDTCLIWRRMGGRDWAEGLVPAVAERFRSLEPEGNPIWRMQKFGELFALQLPIIVSVLNPSTRMIDDGSHRAIAMFLAGLKSTLAWIGELYE